MAVRYLILVLVIQNSLTEPILDDEANQIEPCDILTSNPDDDVIVKDSEAGPNDWIDAFEGSSSNFFPTSSAALMSQATLSDKSPEEQLEDIKEIADQITKCIQSEMANLLSYAISSADNEDTDSNLRKKRSVETPMDSSQLVMRLLKHIKSNNEYQNIAIEKMMTAQEIADKFGIEFTPDPETLSDLAVAANEQAKEMSEILKDACDLKNVTQNGQSAVLENIKLNSTGYLKDCVKQMQDKQHNESHHIQNFEVPKHIYNDDGYEHPAPYYNYYHNHPVESQLVSPVPQYLNAPVSHQPNFYDFISYDPTQDYFPYCSMEPFTAATSVIIPIDEVQLEPELVAEEYEETVSSKVFIDHDEEPGVSTVNHVMSYTVSEKAHFRTPHIESLPQQMQYYFYLM